ncbi:hypothetical protein SAMN04487898_12382 [Pedobacter sp. ok626]|uniref:hypothetical protein n=1 Tax=Pedobacter sp. ok626 TaxID=1761882 RepID=UPI00088586D0|nr:hypothetical protein [Pedobacter sp. ok626]SDL72612.1 hypothetical protein SAMN04487898_12382 [Pedobacter sp. ok626]
MPVSRKRKKTAKPTSKKKTYKPYEVVKQPFREFRTPDISHIPFEERMRILKEFAEKSGKEYERTHIELQNFLAEYDPLYLAAYSILYFISKPEGIDQEAIDGYVDFPVFYVEVLQALSLKAPRTISAKPLTHDALAFKDTLTNFNKNQSYRYFNLTQHAKNPEEMSPVILRMDMMMHTLAVRNWAYEIQMQQVAYDLAECIRDKFKEAIGFDPLILLDILFGLAELTNDKLNDHIKKMRNVYQAKTMDEIFHAHETNYPDMVKVNAEGRKEMWEMCGRNFKQLKWTLLAHGDLRLPEVFSFDPEEVKALVRPEVSTSTIEVTEILDKLSFKFGDLKDTDTDHIFLNNPVHDKPFIQLEDSAYFSAIGFMFSHLGVDLLENFIRTDKNLFSYYSKQKGIYLEDQVRELFKGAFPTAQIFDGSLWKSPTDGKTYENDLIVLIENFAIIIEAKSGTVAPPARRGAPNRLFETLVDLVVAPSEQAIRFEDFLRENSGLHNFSTKSGKSNSIDSSKIDYYIPLGITLSNLGSIGCNLKKLIDAKVIDHTIEQLAPSISLCDLQVIFEILPLEAQKIHYLSRRREFEAHVTFQGDEFDLFGFYLDTGFNIGDTEYDPEYYLNLTLKSKELDPYFIGKHRGKAIKKPEQAFTKYWNDLLLYLRKNSKLWLHVSYILLNASHQDQKDFEKALEKLKKMILNKTSKNKHNWFAFYCGPPRRRYTIIAYAYEGLSKSERNDVMNQIAEKEKKDPNRGFIILGYDLNHLIYPYNVIAGSLHNDFFDSLAISEDE